MRELFERGRFASLTRQKPPLSFSCIDVYCVPQDEREIIMQCVTTVFNDLTTAAHIGRTAQLSEEIKRSVEGLTVQKWNCAVGTTMGLTVHHGKRMTVRERATGLTALLWS